MPPIPLTKKDISDSLSDLNNRGLLGYDKVSESYYFASPEVREQLFSSLTLSVRTKLHLGIIQYYKTEFASSLEAFDSVLGHHYEGRRETWSAQYNAMKERVQQNMLKAIFEMRL